MYLLTIYPDQPTLEMKVSYLKLKEHVDVTRLWYKAGKFPKGDTKEHIQLRNFLLKRVPHREWLLILDSDELLFGDFRLLPEIMQSMEERNELVCSILEIRTSFEMILRPRLIHKRREMEYTEWHDRIFYLGRNILDPKYIRSQAECIGFLHYRFAQQLSIKRIRVDDSRHAGDYSVEMIY